MSSFNKFLYPVGALALVALLEALGVDLGVDYDYVKGAAITALVALFAPANSVPMRRG